MPGAGGRLVSRVLAARWAGSAPGGRAGRCAARAGRKRRAAITGPAQRMVRDRSRRTAAAAATTAAPAAISAICQPAMPPAVITCTPVCGGGTRAGPYGPPGPGITIPAQAAGMTAADASTAPVSAARTAAASRGPAGNRMGTWSAPAVRMGPGAPAVTAGSRGRAGARQRPDYPFPGRRGGRGRTTPLARGQARPGPRPGPGGSGRRGGGLRSCPGSGPGGSGRCGC